MAKILLIDGENIKALDKLRFTEEGRLQDYLEKYPSLIPLVEIVEGPSDLLCIGREVTVPSGAIDLLFIDKDGLLTIVETKLVKNPEIRREVIGQIIEYASFLSQWTLNDIENIANNYFRSERIPNEFRDKTLSEVITEFSPENDFSVDSFNAEVEKNLREGKIRLIIAVDELVEPLRVTVTFLNSYSNFEILLLQISSFEESEARKVLIASVFGYAQKERRLGRTKPKVNEEIFLARCQEEGHEMAMELYAKAKVLKDRRSDNGDFMNWGVSGYSYRMPWEGKPNGETIFIGYGDGTLSLWLEVIETGGTAGQKYLENLRKIKVFASKVDDYRKHRGPIFSASRMTTSDVDAFISAIEELGLALEVESNKHKLEVTEEQT